MIAASVLLVLVLGGLPGWAAEREGSIPEDLAARKPPHPNEIYVVVFPFWSRDETQSELARACVMLNLMRHRFRVAPKGATSLPSAARRTDAALKRDPEWEPLARLGPEDAARVGKTLGAQWAVYGEFGDLHTESEGGSVLRRKRGVIDIRLVLVDVESGDTLYWCRVKDSSSEGGGLWRAKASSIERRLVTQTINGMFDDIAAALPEHYAGPEVSQGEVRELLEAMGK